VSSFYTNLFVVSLDRRIKISDNFESLGQAKSNSRCHNRTLVTGIQRINGRLRITIIEEVIKLGRKCVNDMVRFVFVFLVLDCDNSSRTVEGGLQRALSVLWLNPSVPLYRDVCGALAVHLYNSRSTEADWTVAFYLAEGHAPTLRHSSCLNAVRKMRLDQCYSSRDHHLGLEAPQGEKFLILVLETSHRSLCLIAVLKKKVLKLLKRFC